MWGVFERQSDEGRECHVIPVNDLMQHAITTDCGCWPLIEYVGSTVDTKLQVTGIVVTHHSLDGRESSESNH